MKWLYRGLGLLLVVASLACQALNPPYHPSGVALVYAGNDYPIKPLKGPANDAVGIAKIFRAQGYRTTLRIDQGQNYLSDVTLPARPADLAQLKLDFQSAVAGLQPGENFVFYYAGHGTPFRELVNSSMNGFTAFAAFTEDYPGQLDESTLCLPGSIQGPSYFFPSRNSMKDYALTAHVMAGLLASLPATIHRVVITDACFSGGLIDQGKEFARLPQGLFPGYAPFNFSDDLLSAYQGKLSGSGRVGSDILVLTAAGGGEITPDTLRDINLELGTSYNYFGQDLQGPFTYLIMMAARGFGDSNSDGLVTVSELYSAAQAGYYEWNSIFRARFKSNDDKIPNRPRISGGGVDFVLFSNQ